MGKSCQDVDSSRRPAETEDRSESDPDKHTGKQGGKEQVSFQIDIHLIAWELTSS